ncbi:unnamed protein product [Auanema sp. JU1783]|nr:unnamed protein product [Auanema sp. JU1783]
MKEPDSGSVSENDDFPILDNVSRLTRTVSSVNPVHWNEADLLETDLMGDSPFHYGIGIRPQIKRDAESYSGESRSSSSTSAGSGVIAEEDLIDWAVYQKLLGQSERQCNATSRWSTLILPNSLLISTIEKLTEMIEKGLDVSNDNGLQQMQGLLQQVICPVLRSIFNDDPGMSLDQFVREKVMTCAFRYITMFVTKMKYYSAPDEILPEFFKIMAFMFNINSRFYQRISTHTINAIIRIVPSDLDLSKVNLFITDAETHHWFQALLLWFCQSSGFEAFCKFLQTAITPDSTIPTLAMYFSWLANIIPILHPSIIKKHIEPFVISSYRRLMAVDEKDYECEKVKGDVREAPLMQVLLFCKISVYHFLNIFGRSMLIELDLLKLRFLKCVIAESPFNTRMSALEELYRFLRIGSNDLLGCTVEAQAKIEEIGLIESMYKDNLHHVAYIDRVEKVMADLFDRHLLKENVLNIIWNSQKGKHEVIQRNVQILTARLASHFDSSIAEGFFSMLQISWITGETKDRLNIIELLRRVGFDQSNSCMVSRVANFLWKQTRSEEAIENLEFQARMLDVLYDVLEEVFVDGFGKSTLIPEYILRCANDICCPKTPEAILASSVALSKRIISCYTNEMKTIKNNPIAVNQRLDLFRRIEDNIRFKFGKSYADAMACNIITAVNNLPQVVDSSNSVLSLGSKSEDWDSEYSISRALVVQFEFLKFYYSDLIASFEHLLVPVADPEWVIRLWKAVVNSTFPGVQDIGFRLFTDLVCTSTKCLFPHAERLKIFFEKNVLTLDPKMLSVAGFHCFEAFLKKTNIALANMVFRDDHEEMERNCFLTRTSIMGEEYIWQLITCGNENVHPLASNLFVCLFSSPAPEQRVPEYGEAVIHKCMDVLNKRWEKEAETLAEKAERGVKVRRILQTITELVDTNEKDHRLPKRTRPVLRRSTMGKGFFLKVQFRVDDMQLLFPKSPIPLHVASPKTFNVHDNMLLVELVEKICQSICDQGGVISPYSLSIVSKLGGDFEPFRVSEWGQTLRELGFDSRTTIFAKPEKNRLGYDGTDDAGFLMKSGRRECELEESLLFSVLLASHSDYLVRLVELAQVREVTEQAFALLSNVPSLKQAPSIDEYGSLENTVEPFRRYLEDIARESSPAKQVYSLMVLCEYVAPWNLSSTNCYNNQTLFFFAGGIKVFRNIMVKNAFVDETSQLRGLGFYYALKVLVFSLQFALNVLSYKSEKRVYRFMTDHLPRVTECYMKEAVYRMTNAIYDKHNFSLVNKVITDCKATVRDICDLLESSLSLLKEHAANGIYQETNLEDLECPHEYDNGDLIIVAATQVIGYYCVLNWDICPNVLICTDFYEYLNSVMFGDKSYVNRMVSCWSVDIISQIIIHVGFEVNGHQVYLHVVEQLFNIIDMANTKCFWELLYKIIDHSDKRTRLPNLYSRVLHCLTWLEEAQKTSQEQQCSFPDDITLTGRLRVLSLLLEQLTIDEKADIGGPDGTFRFIELLVNHFLLPSSRAYVQQIDFPRSQTALEIHTASSSSMFDLHAFNIIPRSSSACPIPHRCVAVCGSEESQRAGFAALIAIAVGSEINIRLIRNLFMEMFYRDRSLERIIWDYQPDFSLRVAGNYVGLKNGGATCYMNSILQQVWPWK